MKPLLQFSIVLVHAGGGCDEPEMEVMWCVGFDYTQLSVIVGFGGDSLLRRRSKGVVVVLVLLFRWWVLAGSFECFL